MNSKIYETLKNANVLLVEDDISLKEIIKELISPYVHKIYEATNGEDGLEQFNLNEINLIISDINMLYMSGINMAKQIRKVDKIVPIIFITAYDTEQNLTESISLNSKFFLKKPFDKQQLLISMIMALSEERGDDRANLIDLKNGFTYDIEAKILAKEGLAIELTRTEQRLLRLLANNKNRVISYETIESYTWQGKFASPDTIRNYINRLRSKIYPKLIKNVQGIGYKMQLE
ncbi:response regulator transcription factor [Campylobacter sp. MOP7]|uniref:response regulator transcription factor n=1 Tax=Campylobacter canis TaxID=3378588 RepID=UPI00387E40E9